MSGERRDPARTWPQRLDKYQRRHRRLGFPIGVLYKYFDDQGNYLAALITFYGFLSFFPLLLLLAAVLGFVLDGNPHLQAEILKSTLSQFPVIGSDLQNPQKLGGNTLGIVVGVLLSLYGGLGIAQALQNAMNVAWGVPRNERPNPFQARARSVRILGLGGLSVIGTTVLSAIGNSTQAFGANIGDGLALILTGVSVLVNATLFIWLFKLTPALHLRFRDVAFGAIVAAITLQALQYFGAEYVRSVIRHATPLNSVFALVLGLSAFVYLEAVAIVLCAELNVVRVRRLYPRSLLTPFTDNVDLTRADEVAYASYAHAQRHKGFEEIDVEFGSRRDVGDAPAVRANERLPPA